MEQKQTLTRQLVLMNLKFGADAGESKSISWQDKEFSEL